MSDPTAHEIFSNLALATLSVVLWEEGLENGEPGMPDEAQLLVAGFLRRTLEEATFWVGTEYGIPCEDMQAIIDMHGENIVEKMQDIKKAAKTDG